MEISNSVTEVIRNFTGIKSALPHGVIQASDAEDILNFVTRRGRLRKIWGADLYYNSGLSTKEIKWLEHFRFRWIAQHGKTVLRESAEGSAVFNSIGDMLLGEDNPTKSDKWVNRLYLTNGVENRYTEDTLATDGNELLTLGLIPPGNGAKIVQFQPDIVTSKVAHFGSMLADATYGYVVTWWDNVRKVESLPIGAQVGEDGLWRSFAYAYASSIAAAFTGMANNAVRVDISALKAFGYDKQRVTHFIVYRQTQADPTSLKRCSDPLQADHGASGSANDLFAIDLDYFDDATVEADLGAVLDESLSPPPSGLYYQGYGNRDDVRDQGNYGPKYVKFFRDQLWLFGVDFPGTPNGFKLDTDALGGVVVDYEPQSGILYASSAENQEYWLYTYDIGRSTGQKDTGIAKHRNTLMLFKSGSAYYLDGSNINNYEVRELDTKRGITIPGSLAETSKGPIGIGAEGFTLFDSVTGGKIISEEITNFVERINPNAVDKINAVFDIREEKYECHVPLDNFTWNTHVFIYDLKTESWEITQRAGGAAAYGISTKKQVVSLLGDSRNGRLYETDNYASTTFNGQTLHGKYRSKAFDFGQPGKLKNVQKVEIVASGLRDFNLSIAVIPDFGQADAAEVNDLESNLRDDIWAASAADTTGMKWDSGQWSKAAKKKKFHFLIQAIGHNFNLLVKNSDTDADSASFEIEEIIVEASLLEGDDDD